MATPTEMRALATTLEETAPHVDTPYGPGQVATYGLAWEALREGADEIERLRHENAACLGEMRAAQRKLVEFKQSSVCQRIPEGQEKP